MCDEIVVSLLEHDSRKHADIDWQTTGAQPAVLQNNALEAVSYTDVSLEGPIFAYYANEQGAVSAGLQLVPNPPWYFAVVEHRLH